MKHWIGLLLAIGSTVGVADDDGLVQVMRALAAVSTVQAAFREEKTLAILQEPLMSTGLLDYHAPDFLRKRTLYPQPEEYEADGNWLTVETPTTGHQQFDLNGYPQLRSLVEAIRATQSGNQAALDRDYRLEFQGTPSDWILRLTPRAPEAAQYVSVIILHGQQAWIHSVETREPDGDRSLMTITER